MDTVAITIISDKKFLVEGDSCDEVRSLASELGGGWEMSSTTEPQRTPEGQWVAQVNVSGNRRDV
jgi:hypothetical protein